MTFEGKSETSYIELIALYLHPNNIKHLRSHSRAIMALAHSRFSLRNKFLENKSGRIFLRSTGLLNKFLPTNLGVSKPTFYTLYVIGSCLYTSHVKWNSTIYRGSEWGRGVGGPLVACRLKFSYFVGSRLKFSIFVGCRLISVNK